MGNNDFFGLFLILYFVSLFCLLLEIKEYKKEVKSDFHYNEKIAKEKIILILSCNIIFGIVAIYLFFK